MCNGEASAERRSDCVPDGKVRYLKWVGGRKQLNAYVFVVILSVAAYLMNGDFATYAQWLATGLIGVSVATAWEDRGRSWYRNRPQTSVQDGDIPPEW